jgi:hypothetical protein
MSIVVSHNIVLKSNKQKTVLTLKSKSSPEDDPIKKIKNCRGKHNKLWLLCTDKNKSTSHLNPQQTLLDGKS